MKAILRAALLCALAAPTQAMAAKSVPLSWGKVGVSFEQYRADAVECGRSGYYLDVSGTEAAQVFKRATSTLENSELGVHFASEGDIIGIAIASARIVAGTRPEARMAEVRQLLQGTVDGCLIERGYTPFRLNESQKKQLRKLHYGSQARHAYLHGLATDPAVVKGQAVGFVLKDQSAGR